VIFSNAVSNSSSKLERLFYPVSVKRDIRALNLIFERAFENDTPNILEFVSKQFGQTILWTFVRSHYWLLGRYSGSFLSVNRLSLQVEKSARKTRTYLSVDQLSSEFSRIHAKETHKSFDPTKAKCCKQRGKTRLFKLWVSCGFLNKRDLWKMMHRQIKLQSAAN